MNPIDFSCCCQHARRIIVDWEDKGVLQLLDMDHILCGCGEHPEVVDIRNCCDCPEAIMDSDLGLEDEDIETWTRWSSIRSIEHGQTSEDVGE